ncbi:MAG: hypothetical protein OEW32_11830 [Nitrospira sp.]|nr:hypothetical protein [Nitrospira sp.]
MSQRRSPVDDSPHIQINMANELNQHQPARGYRQEKVRWLLILLGLLLLPSVTMANGPESPRLLTDVVTQRADQLALIESDEGAVRLFTTSVGPALGLKDAAGALGARLPSKMIKELGVPELSQSVSDLMRALGTWQFANALRQETGPSTPAIPLSAARQDWLRTKNQIASFSDLLRLTKDTQGSGTAQGTRESRNVELILAAERTAFEASHQAITTWWTIHGWKDRVRQAKGHSRLCGTWQWIIHNHQIHGEQKSTIIFSLPGQASANAAMPAESIILGDAIYLRWEQNGHIQEDSLLFIKDDEKIEGSFMNNTGGWGPISGKRLAPCKP